MAGPVSYTHLHIKKVDNRYVVSYSLTCIYASLPVECIKFCMVRIPVSYTHLDVYKRQRLVTPLSRSKFPNINMPSSGAMEGKSRQVNRITTIGNMIFSFLVTTRN